MCRATLRKSISHWNKIGTSDVVKQWILEGVRLPFHEVPDNFELQNHTLSNAQQLFIQSEIHRLIECDYIEVCERKPKCVSPLGCVPKRNGKYRLITDLRNLNSFCSPPRYKNEDVRDLASILKPHDKFISLDIKDGFYHIPVHPLDREYLGFCWSGVYYRWKVLPFGLNSSPYFFAKTVRPVLEYLRSIGLRVTVYVDDFLLGASDKYIVDAKDQLLHTLEDLGFLINFEKSQLNPSTKINYIGYTISNAQNKLIVKVQSCRISKLKRAIRRALKERYIKARSLAKIAGQCVSTAWAVTPGKLLLRNIYRLLSKRDSWDSNLAIGAEVVNELTWWLTAASHWNSRELCTRPVEIQVITDASHLGWGAVCNGKVASGDWNTRVSCASSNYREMMAIFLAIISFRAILKNKSVQILSDNITSIAYINHKGGPCPKLSQIATSIWTEAFDNGMSIQCAHIAGRKNFAADYWSRTPDKHNWMLHPKLFSYINRMWGPHTIDRFANCLNTQLPRFNSRYYEPLSEGIDALSQDNWQQENNYVNAPFCLIPRVLDVVESQRAVATVIAPKWPAQPWYQRLVKLSIARPLKLPQKSKIYRSMGVVPEPCRNTKWQIYAWRIFGVRA